MAACRYPACTAGWLCRWPLTDWEERARYEILAGAYRDLEGSSGRLVLIGRLAGLVRETPDELLPMVVLVCQGQLAPDVAGVELGVAEWLAARAVAQVAGVPAEQVLAGVRDTGDLGLAARAAARLAGRRPVGDPGGRGGGPGAAPGRRGAGGAGSQGRKLAGLVGRLERATPLEGR